MLYHLHMTWTLHPSHLIHEHVSSSALCHLPNLFLCTYSFILHVLLPSFVYHTRLPLVIARKPASVPVTHSIAVCHLPSRALTFSLLQFCLDRYTFIAASWTMYPSLHVHSFQSFPTCVALLPAFSLPPCSLTNDPISLFDFAAVY